MVFLKQESWGFLLQCQILNWTQIGFDLTRGHITTLSCKACKYRENEILSTKLNFNPLNCYTEIQTPDKDVS